jgi:hypothetical protein
MTFFGLDEKTTFIILGIMTAVMITIIAVPSIRKKFF